MSNTTMSEGMYKGTTQSAYAEHRLVALWVGCPTSSAYLCQTGPSGVDAFILALSSSLCVGACVRWWVTTLSSIPSVPRLFESSALVGATETTQSTFLLKVMLYASDALSGLKRSTFCYEKHHGCSAHTFIACYAFFDGRYRS
jgi:hypothetical protein